MATTEYAQLANGRYTTRTYDGVAPGPWPEGATVLTEAQYEAAVAQVRADAAAANAVITAEETEQRNMTSGGRVRIVNGPVTDETYPGTEVLDGSIAVDSAANRLYVRVNGGWKFTPLS